MKLGSLEHLDYCAQQQESCRIATSDESLMVMDRVGAQIGELDWMAAIAKEKTSITPGPWTIDDGDTDALGVFAEDGAAICYLSEAAGAGLGLRGREIDSANVQLIAAAPEMYKALVSIREWLLFTETLADPSKIYLEAFVKANNLALAAIAKAEGRNV